jgi:tRNA(Ile)-lysidine synthase
MGDAILIRTRNFLVEQGLLRADLLLVAAVSGGPDSLCLLHVLWQLRQAGGPLVHVAHLDHGFRGAESAAEAEFVRATAAAWGLPATLAYRDVPALARERRESAQAAARAVRYAFLAEVAEREGAAGVMVAHHADDQAETVLMHLLHGAGIAGLKGMLPRTVLSKPGNVGGAQHAASLQSEGEGHVLLRPLLSTTRAEIEAYCVAQGLEPRRDPSNHSSHYTRSRVRERILPTLAEENPQIVDALGRTAALCAADYAFISDQLAEQWPMLAREFPRQVVFDQAIWQPLHTTLKGYALRRAVQQLAGHDTLSFAQIEAGLRFLAQGRAASHELGAGLWLEVGYNTIAVAFPDAFDGLDGRFPQLVGEAMRLPIPGVMALNPGWEAETRLVAPEESSPWWIAIQREWLGEALFLRRRVVGERFRPAGGQGSKRLQDLFVDMKIPRRYRANWPVLANREQLIWVAGLRAAEGFVADEHIMEVVWVGLRPSM